MIAASLRDCSAMSFVYPARRARPPRGVPQPQGPRSPWRSPLVSITSAYPSSTPSLSPSSNPLSALDCRACPGAERGASPVRRTSESRRADVRTWYCLSRSVFRQGWKRVGRRLVVDKRVGVLGLGGRLGVARAGRVVERVDVL